MDDVIRIDKVSYTDYTKAEISPISREECLENMTKTLLWIANRCKTLELEQNV